MVDGTSDEDWIGLSSTELSVDQLQRWAVTPSCGAVVTFAGTVRDCSAGRVGVESLEYEAYEEQALVRIAAIVANARERWPVLGRIAVFHRTGTLVPTETAVVVVATSPSRPDAFEAARFLIDTVKATVPIWKRERWQDGEAWSDGVCVEGAGVSVHVGDDEREPIA